MITPDLLRAAVGCTVERAEAFAGPLSEACAHFEINTPQRVAVFLAQLGHESGSLQYMAELASGDAYEGRADLGNTQPGDGRRYKGHGPIQITGRDNHRAVRPALLLAGYTDVPDFEAEPDRLTEPRWGCASSAEFWARHGLNALADRGEFIKIGRAINRGNANSDRPANGEADRIQRLNRAQAAFDALQHQPSGHPETRPDNDLGAKTGPQLAAPAPAAAPTHYAPAGEADAPEQQEKPMLPFIAAGLSALIQNAPALIRVFGDSPQAEKNAKAAEVVAGIAQQVTGQSTVEGAVRAIEASPDVAAQYREAVHKSMTAGELLQVLVAAGEADDKSRTLALDRNLQLASATGGRWLWLLGGVAVLVVVMSYLMTAGVLFWQESTFSDETKALLLGQVVIFGFVTILGFLFGSNIQNRISQRDKQERGE